MGDFHKKVREISQGLIKLLEKIMDANPERKALYDDIIQDHTDLLRGVVAIPIINSTYSRTFSFLQEEESHLKAEESFTQAVLCRVMAKRVRGVIIASLRETQPIEILDMDDKE
jgi:hypothetical protein